MSDSTSQLDLVSFATAQKEPILNAVLNALSPASVFGRRDSTTAGLTWGYYGGPASVAGDLQSIASGTITLTANATNYIEFDPTTGTVTSNTSGFTKTALYEAVTGASTILTWKDWRVFGGDSVSHAEVAADIAAHEAETDPHPQYLTQADATGLFDPMGIAATVMDAHKADTDPHPQYLTPAEGDVRYAAAGATSGVTSVNTKTGDVTLTAADVGALATTQLGAANGAAQLGSDQKLLSTQLPDLAIITHLGTVADQAAMLALTGQKGDWAIRSDDGKVYIITGSDPTQVGSWTPLSYPTGNGGTVTSVGLAVPGLLYTVSGSPVTTSGTLTFTLKVQSANKFLAGPVSGADATPTMRAIVAADLPIFGPSGPTHSAGAVPDPGSSVGNTKFLREDGVWGVPPGTGSAGMANPMTASGDLIVGGGATRNDALTSLGASVTSSGGVGSDLATYPALNSVDANDTTFCRESWATGSYIRVDLGANRSIVSYRVKTGSQFLGYKLQSSTDGTTWTDQSSTYQTTDTGVVLLGTATTARYWRILKMDGNGSYWDVFSFELYENSTAGTPTRLGVGTNGYVLTADSTAANGMAWKAVSIPAQPFDLTAFYPGVPSASAIVTRVPVARVITFPAGLTGSVGKASVAATAQTDFDVQKNGTSVGTVRFAAGATTATFIAASQFVTAVGDLISIIAPATPDATLANVGIVLVGSR